MYFNGPQSHILFVSNLWGPCKTCILQESLPSLNIVQQILSTIICMSDVWCLTRSHSVYYSIVYSANVHGFMSATSTRINKLFQSRIEIFSNQQVFVHSLFPKSIMSRCNIYKENVNFPFSEYFIWIMKKWVVMKKYC